MEVDIAQTELTENVLGDDGTQLLNLSFIITFSAAKISNYQIQTKLFVKKMIIIKMIIINLTHGW